MNRQKENRYSWIGTIAMIGLFLCVICFFGNADSSTHITCKQHMPIQVEHVVDVDHSAILVSSSASFNVYPSGIACNVSFNDKVSHTINLAVLSSTNKINQLLKNSRKQFVAIKSTLIDIDSFHVRTSLDSGEVLLIS